MEIKDIKNVVKYSSLGIEFGGFILVFVFLGIFLDKKFSTKPLFAIIGIFLGFILGMVRLFKIAKDLDKLDKRDKIKKKDK